MKIYYALWKAHKLSTHWLTGHSTHLWLADKSQTNLWAILYAGPGDTQIAQIKALKFI